MSRARWLLLPLSLGIVAAVPGVSDFDRALADAEHHGRHAAAVGRAAAGMQNALAQRLEEGLVLCEDPTVRALLARSRYLGHAYRDAAQAARVRADHVDRLRSLPTIAPLLSAAVAKRADDVVKHGHDEVERYRATAGWQSQMLESQLGGCTAALQPGPGLTAPPRGDDPIAVIGLGQGRLCPADVPAEGAVIVVDGGEACWSQEGCGCTPAPIGPGAVLSPDRPRIGPKEARLDAPSVAEAMPLFGPPTPPSISGAGVVPGGVGPNGAPVVDLEARPGFAVEPGPAGAAVPPSATVPAPGAATTPVPTAPAPTQVAPVAPTPSAPTPSTPPAAPTPAAPTTPAAPARAQPARITPVSPRRTGSVPPIAPELAPRPRSTRVSPGAVKSTPPYVVPAPRNAPTTAAPRPPPAASPPADASPPPAPPRDTTPPTGGPR